ncbi:flagellar hook-associated protein FlgK [Rheinheimera baltica]|uniref:Flagellar hook-associated protein 1 n=2 Tax=Rheinheimera baltica TaxID=67576 RepID=A0ABT9HUN8_9GAMM|nr:flagellar hook-associated protein FlgK [Rheinheimera baltica]MDP5134845.1 flagellar hook-associated protein FlgK [Rheinheimera baltica]MDP5143193.1 flagellar hook-associated protein FlgK [Rheinheimera baltica]MDP5149904.1 flagellar hook-associated protein FlgK [Rheinheimera baltica]
MSDNLLRIGTSAIMANSTLLNTTSNNIANVNTSGYSRQRTEFESQILGLGVGQGTTDRLISEFTSIQLRRDTSKLAFAKQYTAEANRIDGLFSNPANSISTAMNDLFQKLQTANNDPNAISTRQLIISSSESLIDRFATLSNLVLDQATYVNQQLDLDLTETNSLIKNVSELNRAILSFGSGDNAQPPLDLLDRRDEALRMLSEKLDIKVLDSGDGEKLVFMSTGQSLVVENGEFSILSLNGNPDPNVRNVELSLNSKPSVVRNLGIEELGGQIGGLLKFRDDLLIPTQMQMGQLALAMADTLNSQNKLGMNGNGDLGGNLFVLPQTNGLAFQSNTGSGSIVVDVEPGRVDQLPPNDFLVTFTAPDTFTLEATDTSGNILAGSAISVSGVVFPATLNATDLGLPDYYGLSLQVSGPMNNGDRFALKPLSSAARNVNLATTRPEDIALASPVRSIVASDNLGNAKIDSLIVTDTDPTTSAFAPPSSITGAPLQVIHIGGNQFEVRDSSNTLLGTTPALPAGQLNNIMAQAGLGNYGFDFNVTGIPQTGDSFTVEYNTGGFNDNRNGLEMGKLQTAETMRRYAVSTPNADNSVSFNEAYGTMVSFVGDKTSQARNSQAAAEALYSQTLQLKESLSGVSLDEEAANLVRFQQSYAASAKIIATSQIIFDTLLQSVR